MQNESIKINFSDPINTQSVKNFIGVLDRLCIENPNAESLIINISSPGGNVDVAIELYHFLRELGCEIQTVNTSYVNSAAIIVFLAGDIRICHIASSFYVHSISKRLRGNYDAQKLLKEVKEINANTDIVATLLGQRTMKSKQYWKTLMSKGTILKANQALKLGIVSSIIDIN